ncbi:MAG TPA: hypothetical protein VFA76_05210 [Terriglobales bacterium]|nr:hypothetical protein [Terriglobales bacterium]
MLTTETEFVEIVVGELANGIDRCLQYWMTEIEDVLNSALDERQKLREIKSVISRCREDLPISTWGPTHDC